MHPSYICSFSTYFATPSWQRKAVSSYLAQVNLTAGFNPYGRAYPDISLLGTNYQTFVSGKIYSLYGTSVGLALPWLPC